MALELELPYGYAPRDYQIPLWNYIEENQNGRAVIVWPRRHGKDLTCLNILVKEAHKRVGTYWAAFPTATQAREVWWDGKDREGRAFMDYIPPDLVESTNATQMSMTFKNGSLMRLVGTDNIDRRVGTNPVGVVFSEYSLQNPEVWGYLRPILKENNGWAVFIFTPRGKNHAWKLFKMAQDNKRWFVDMRKAGDKGTLRPDGTPVFSDLDIDEERKEGMPEEMVQQEYFCSFDAGLVGSYYAGSIERLEKSEPPQITAVPFDPKLQVHTAWDIGYRDTTAIWFFQRYGMEYRFIDFYMNNGEGLPHYAKVLLGQTEGGSHRADYTYARHYAPHDIQVHEFSTGRARIEVARSLGIRFTMAGQHEVADGIEAVRSILPSCWFDESRCATGIEALKGYRKEYDSKMKVFRETPTHDWMSHPADAFRYFAWGVRPEHKKKTPRDHKQKDDYDYLNGMSTDLDYEDA